MKRKWEIEWDDDALKQFSKIGGSNRAIISKYLNERVAGKEDPRSFGKALSGNLKGMWRYRVGDFRIICRIEDHRLVVLIVGLGHRKEVYDV